MGLFTGEVTYTEVEPGETRVGLNERDIGTLYSADSTGYLFEYRMVSHTKKFPDIAAAKDWIEDNAGDIEDGYLV